jgi:hypothetical protein
LISNKEIIFGAFGSITPQDVAKNSSPFAVLMGANPLKFGRSISLRSVNIDVAFKQSKTDFDLRFGSLQNSAHPKQCSEFCQIALIHCRRHDHYIDRRYLTERKHTNSEARTGRSHEVCAFAVNEKEIGVAIFVNRESQRMEAIEL